MSRHYRSTNDAWSSPKFVSALAAAGVVVWVLLLSPAANAGRVASFYLEPHFGAARVIMKAVEIERSFVSTIGQKDVQYSWTDVNINVEGGIAPVGRMIGYTGSGVELGFGTGIKISGLQAGFTLTFINAAFSGYSKRYRYSPELLRAEGKKYTDADTVPMLRLLGSVKYGIPVRRLLLMFQTRIGRMKFRDTSLVLGRAVEKDNGITADVGIEVALRPSRWISVGFLGYGGFFAFTGKYEGGMGGIFGGNGTFCVYF
ncbi:MAG: hypothetical protein JXX14_22615 [Deltaproteobacteria bacterium]|nr:hypothetical protein [Deltaproteobacteria bacterium]